ncbi:protein phosphatase Slingshot homolog 1-like isoform X2 [Homarus americanus]|uniref:protein phosphatase Slingshot homolog 1-like isoform X2 n=1 Tax=Homarus americanus TaxID=6706 RepID=UPI001C47BF95|nr:protein phosphatase Slingshot homolog 1-like isoform X2 [Homarus americanus]
MGRRRIQRCNTRELKSLLLEPSGGRWYRPVNSYDEVFPGVLLGDSDTALSTQEIKDLGITHILNAAQGHNNTAYDGYVSTSPSYYAKLKGLKYYGIPALDMPGFYIKPYLRDAADFINGALKQGGRVLVHCQCGISRSAALVVGFLMLKRNMNVQTALATIKKKRNVFPNQGFLSQLCDFDYELRRSGDLPDNPEDRPVSPILELERESSPFRNPAAYPRFTLVPSKVFDTYTSTKNYVKPSRASSLDRYEPPRKNFQDNPLVDSSTRSSRGMSPGRAVSPSRAMSPARRGSLSFLYDDDDLLENPKVFDTYRRYTRSSTSPLPTAPYVSSLAKPYDPYVSMRYPKSYYYDRYYSQPTYEYINNLGRYYDTYKYNRAASPFSAPSTTVAPASIYRTYRVYPDRAYLMGSSYTPPYPYTEKYFSPFARRYWQDRWLYPRYYHYYYNY